MSYVRRFNSKRGRVFSLPYHAYAPLHHDLVSSVTFCVALSLCVCVCAVEIYAAARMRVLDASWHFILFYFICINHVACDAIEKYICLLGNFAPFLPLLSSLLSPILFLCRQCRKWRSVQGHGTQQDHGQRTKSKSKSNSRTKSRTPSTESWQVHTFRFGC